MQLSRKIIFFVLFGIFYFVNPVLGQLEVKSINRQSAEPNASSARLASDVDTLNLPFWDDFSFSVLNPDTAFWVSNRGVLINATIGQVSPTINIASFDGNDSFGVPYKSEESNYGDTDQMVSQPINLSNVEADKRASVYFSFYWQMKGLGETPEEEDSLFLDFKNVDGEWERQWSVIGIEENSFETFKKVMIQIDPDDVKFYHAGFQFRFSAKGNAGGTYDAWHLDYVYLNQDRVKSNEFLDDKSIASLPTSIFKDYSMIPYQVLFDFPDTIYQEITFDISKFQDGDGTTDFIYTLTDYRNLNSGNVTYDTLVDSVFVGPYFGLNGNRGQGKFSALSHAVFQNAQEDSIFLQSEFIFLTEDQYFISSIDGTDTTFLEDEFYNYRLNDTVRSYFEIHSTLAYDDGVAEYAAGLNKNEAMLAIEFEIPSVDTLTHIDIYFPRINPLPEGRTFNFLIASDTSGDTASILAKQEFQVQLGDGINTFTRYKFAVPAIVSGKFYVIFQQYDNEYIPIGLDETTQLGLRKLWVKLEDTWQRNVKVEGMVMIRPVFEQSDYIVSSIDDLSSQRYLIYPNPAHTNFSIKGAFDYYECYDVAGQLKRQGKDEIIPVSSLEKGVYILRIFKDNQQYFHKVIIE